MKTLFALTAASIAFALPTAPAEARPANTMRELGQELRACFASVRLGGSTVTIVFSLKRDGSLLGKPRISYSKPPDDPEVQRRDFAEIAQALDACLPLSITDALGGAIAGRPIALPIRGGRAPTNI